MGTDKLTTGELVQMRLAHLTMIQGIVARMATVSASIKGVAFTATAALLAMQHTPQVATGSLIIFVCLALAAADAAYLGMEIEFRAFYDTVAARPLQQAHDLKIRRPPGHFDAYQKALRSWSVVGTYLPLAAVAALLELILP